MGKTELKFIEKNFLKKDFLYVEKMFISDCNDYLIIFKDDGFGYIYAKEESNCFDLENLENYNRMGDGSTDWVLSINDKEKIKSIINKSILREKELYIKMINIHFKARHKKQNKELIKIYISKLRKLKECY